MDVDMGSRSLNHKQSISQHDWTASNLCSDLKVCMTPGENKPDRADPTYEGYYARIVGREKYTGLSVTLSVLTRAYVVIEFPQKYTNVKARAVQEHLEAAMLDIAWKDLQKKIQKRRAIDESLLPEQNNSNSQEKDKQYVAQQKATMVVEWDLDVVVEYHKRGFGFFPDLDRPPCAEDPTLHVKNFPFALVFVKNSRIRDLVSEAVYSKRHTLSVEGWRLAELSATPTLQFLEASGIKPSAPIRVSLQRITFPTRYHFTTDIEGTMEFNPLDIRPVHKSRRITNPRYAGEDHVLTHGPQTVVQVTRTPAVAQSPFSLGEDLLAIPRKRLAVFDIETVTKRVNSFPNRKNPEDPIICISVVIEDSGSSAQQEAPKEFGYVLALPGVSRDRCELEDQYDMNFCLLECSNEIEILAKMRDLLQVDFDVDLVTGWNVAGYDWEYILGRIELHDLHITQTSRATYMSREIRRHCRFSTTTTASKAHGARTKVMPDTPLVIHFDMMVIITNRKKLENYSLNFVAEAVLGSKKVDLSYEEMFASWLSKDPERRRRVAAYCFEDGKLPLRIWRKELLDSQVTAMARVCTVLYADVLNRGELIKSYSLLFVFSHRLGYILTEDPTVDKVPTWKLRKEQEQLQQAWVLRCRATKAVLRKELTEFKEASAARRQHKMSYTTKCKLDDEAISKSLTQRLKDANDTLKLADAGFTESKVLEAAERRLECRPDEAVDESEDQEWSEDDEDHGDCTARFEGAKVLEPKIGLHKLVATQDYKALYPSIIQEQNISPDTLALDPTSTTAVGWEFNEISIGANEIAKFVKYLAPKPDGSGAKGFQGLVPLICIQLLEAREVEKRRKAAAVRAGNMELAAVHDGAQLALKVVANSQYGALGAPSPSGKYPCLPCARAVTGRGRAMLEITRDKVQENPELVVIYGDTDSVMVSYDKWRLDVSNPDTRLDLVFVHAASMAKSISDSFGAAIELEFEKVFINYFLISKKRYFGLKMEKRGDKPKMSSSGVASIRRSSCKLQKMLFLQLQESFTTHPDDTEGRHEMCRSLLQRVLTGNTTIDEFQRSCQLKGPYASPQPQSVVQQKIRDRKPGSEPRTGDRVTYVMRRLPGCPNAKTCEMAEDPAFMVENSLPVATYYYICSFRACIEQLFEVEGKGMKRIQLIFDQAEDIAYAQTMGTTPVPNGGQINGYSDSLQLERASISRGGQQEVRRETLYTKKHQEERLVHHAKSFFANWAVSPAHVGAQQTIASNIGPQDPVTEKKEKTAARKEFFKSINKRKAHADSENEAKRLADIDRRQKSLQKQKELFNSVFRAGAVKSGAT